MSIRSLIFIFALIGGLCLGNSCNAVEVDNALGTPASTAQKKTSTPSEGTGLSVRDSQSAQIQVLRAQVEIMQSYNERILDTIYWALGTILTLVAVLLGLNWFGAKRIHDSDIKSIKDNLRTDFIEHKSELDSSFSKALEDFKEMASKHVIDSIAEHSSGTRILIESANQKLRNLRNDLDQVEARNELRHWQYRDVPANQFNSHLELIRVAKRMGNDWQIDSALDELKELLRNHRMDIDAEQVSELTDLLAALPSRHKVNADSLLRVLQE